jgi:GT2 family glycosyltransferase
MVAALDERDERIDELSERVREREEQLNRLRQSTTWRLTAPFRKFRPSGDPAEVAQDHRRQNGIPSGHSEPDMLPSVPGNLSQSSAAEDRFIRSTRPLVNQLRSVQPGGGRLQGKQPPPSDRNDYREWIERYDTLGDTDRIRIRYAIDNMPHKPLLSVVIPVSEPNIEWLEQAVDSVQNQLYPNWELCIAADDSVGNPVKDYLEALPGNNARIKVVFSQNWRFPTAINRALEICSACWVALLGQEDVLPEHALFHIAVTIGRYPDLCQVYSDEDRIDANGVRSGPYFKCDWNRDLFHSQNFMSRLGVYRRDILEEIGGFRKGFEGAEEPDLALRYVEKIDTRLIHHIPRVLYHRRIRPDSTSPGMDMAPGATAASVKALQEHLDRTGTGAIAEYSPSNGQRVRYTLPANPPLVSLIIPTKNRLSLLRTCIDSIEIRTSYPNYEVLVVDNGSDDPATIDYLACLREHDRIRILHDARPFNYAELNNSAVEDARGELIGLVNNDTEVIEKEWLSEMVSIALQPGVGIVGAKLLYPEGTVQHAGVVLGIGGVAGHAFKRLQGDGPGYFNRAAVVSSFSALTGACQVMRKNVFLQVGGLDSKNLAIAFNDIDFCIRVRESGYRNVFTPYALLYHHESASRGLENTPEKKARFAGEVEFMKKRWGDKLLYDPAYSPNLTLVEQDFSLAWPPRLREPY